MVPPHYIRFRNRNRGHIASDAVEAARVADTLRAATIVGGPWCGLSLDDWLRRYR